MQLIDILHGKNVLPPQPTGLIISSDTRTQSEAKIDKQTFSADFKLIFFFVCFWMPKETCNQPALYDTTKDRIVASHPLAHSDLKYMINTRHTF